MTTIKIPSLLIGIALTYCITVFAQEEIRFGYPVKASSFEPDNLLALSKAQPPRELAKSAKIVLVSGYKPAGHPLETNVQVNVNLPGSKVLLVMTSYEKINWQVTASSGTSVVGMLVSSHYPPTVQTTLHTQGYILKLPAPSETENENFKVLLEQLNALFGIDRVDAFRGSYAIPSRVDISALDPPCIKLTLKGPQPKASNSDFTFDLLARDYRKVRWTLNGHAGYSNEGKVAVSDSGETAYKLMGDSFAVVDVETGKSRTIPLPPNFPIFSWAMDLAYDTKRKIVSVVSSGGGGDGFLYRFDTTQEQWIDYRSLSHIEISSLSYDAIADRYVAWTSGGDLIFVSGEGAAMFTKKVVSRLEGFGRLYDWRNEQKPRIRLAAKGDDIAIIHIRENSVSRIWHYNVKTENAELTYAQD